MIELELARGGTAIVIETDGENVTLLAVGASPPGSTLHARFGESAVAIKVRGSRKVEPDAAGRTFRVEGRFQSLPRHVRVRMVPEAKTAATDTAATAADAAGAATDAAGTKTDGG